MDRQYVILNENKEPTHKFKNGGKPWDEVKNELNLALIVPKGFVVLDFDTESDAKIIKDIVNGMNLPVRMMQTTRGVHVWFKSPEGEEIKNGIKQRLASEHVDVEMMAALFYVAVEEGYEIIYLILCCCHSFILSFSWIIPVFFTRVGIFVLKCKYKLTILY